MSKRRSLAFFVLFAALFALADQLIKRVIHGTFVVGQTKVLIPGFLNLIYLRNRGGAFSLLAGLPPVWGRVFFIVATLAALTFVLYLYRSNSVVSGWGRFGLVLVFGGGLGNLIDRVMHGEVIDFILLYYRGYHWPAFNLADSGITIGVVLLALDLLRRPRGRDDADKSEV